MDVQGLKSPSDYQTERQNAFPSTGALEWFTRRHRAALDKAGALVTINRRVLIAPDRFDGVVLRVGAQQASGTEA